MKAFSTLVCKVCSTLLRACVSCKLLGAVRINTCATNAELLSHKRSHMPDLSLCLTAGCCTDQRQRRDCGCVKDQLCARFPGSDRKQHGEVTCIRHKPQRTWGGKKRIDDSVVVLISNPKYSADASFKNRADSNKYS